MKTSSQCLTGLVVALVTIMHLGFATDSARGQCAPGGCFGTFATVGVYDEQTVNMNAVDAEFANNNITLDAFKTRISTAYNAQSGGVINFDTIQNAVEGGPPAFGVLFGSDLSFDMVASRVLGIGTDGAMNTNTNHTVTSGANYLGISGAAAFTIQFSLPLSMFGMTILERGGQAGNLTLTYNDATTYNWGGVVNIAAGQDTFFAHEAPAGKKISAISWVTTGVGSGYIRTDDWAFEVADFKPGDADGDLDVDLIDYGIIRDHLGQTGLGVAGDVRANGIVDLDDFKLWKKFYVPPGAGGVAGLSVGAVPEPTAMVLVLMGAVSCLGWRRSRR